MKKRLDHFSILQSSKVMGLLYLIGSAIFAIPFTLFAAFVTKEEDALWWLLVPFFYGALGYICSIFMFWIYNIVAKWVGGVEFTLADKADEPRV